MKISIIIPNFNGLNLLKKNLHGVLNSGIEGEVIVVDDASTDGSVEYLTKNYPEVKLISKKVNEGFSSAINVGVSHAKYDLLLLLNNDVSPKKDFTNYLFPLFKDPNVFAVGCLEESYEKKRKIFRGRGIGSFNRGFLIHKRGKIDSNSTLWVSGGGGMFRKDIWIKLGGFNTIYNPFYWEDIDLSYRAVKSGYKILFEKKSIISHFHQEGIIKTTKTKREINRIAYRNQFTFIWVNITDLYYLFSNLFFCPYYIFKAIIRGDYVFIEGFIMAVGNVFKILKIRRGNLKKFRLSDKEILDKFIISK